MIQKNGNKLRIIVEASGHINFDKCMKQDQKGLWSFKNDGKTQLKWKMFKIPIDNKILQW